jgi:GT2 family glycosyltransferase
MNDSSPQADIGAVAIGRNEGVRLERCLRSLVGRVGHVVYVDSGSTDGSVALARSMGVAVIELDTTVPFTAARARNAGIRAMPASTTFVQVVDADCEVVDGWLDAARRTLLAREDVAVVCGRRRERFPDASVYNRLADLEWDTPVGEAKACGGDAMFRLDALRAAGGYNDALICGEEPELCVRLRAAGWKVLRIDHDMTLHDAAMTRLSQWWKRAVRGGWAYAEGAAMHGRPPERHNVRQTLSVWLWGLVVPLIAVAGAYPTRGWSLLLLLAYPLMIVKVFVGARRGSMPASHAAAWACSCVLGKFPQMAGQCRYWLNRLRGRRATLIEYKGAVQG